MALLDKSFFDIFYVGMTFDGLTNVVSLMGRLTNPARIPSAIAINQTQS
jgi:hypothetical protein